MHKLHIYNIGDDEHYVIYTCRWSKIAAHFPGRTDNEIKNVWNTHLKKRLMNKKGKGTSSSSDDDDEDHDDEGHKNETIIIPPPKDASSDGSPTSWSSSSSSSSSTKDGHATTTEAPPESSTPGNHDSVVDMEIWDMLDSLDEASPQDEEIVADLQSGSSSGGEIDKQVEWLRYLENELGLADSSNSNHAQPQKGDDDSNHNLVLLDSFDFDDDDDFNDMVTSLYFPTWPPCSPQHFGV